MGNAKGLGLLVGLAGSGDGLGVLAKGDKGMCPTDFLRFGEWIFFAAVCNLCFKPCKVLGL